MPPTELAPAARTLGVVLQSVEVRCLADFEGATDAINERHPDALLTLGDPLTVTLRTGNLGRGQQPVIVWFGDGRSSSLVFGIIGSARTFSTLAIAPR